MQKFIRRFQTDQSGSVAVVTAIGLFSILGLVALGLDISHLIEVRAELQRAADAGALAGARGLYPDVINLASFSSPPNCGQAYYRSRATVARNIVDGAAPGFDAVSVQTGTWDYGAKTFVPSCNTLTNTVQVRVQKLGINMLFARIFGITQLNCDATSTAVMDWVKGLGPGTLPIAVNEDYAKSGNVEKITFNPATSDVGGWFAVPPGDSTSASTLNDYIDTGSCPPIKVGDIIDLSNGVVESVLKNLKNRLAEHGGTWDTALPVVDSTQFNENKPVKGFLIFRITEVSAHGNDKYVSGIPLGLGMGPGAAIPGGSNYGVLAPPKLVK